MLCTACGTLCAFQTTITNCAAPSGFCVILVHQFTVLQLGVKLCTDTIFHSFTICSDFNVRFRFTFLGSRKADMERSKGQTQAHSSASTQLDGGSEYFGPLTRSYLCSYLLHIHTLRLPEEGSFCCSTKSCGGQSFAAEQTCGEPELTHLEPEPSCHTPSHSSSSLSKVHSRNTML